MAQDITESSSPDVSPNKACLVAGFSLLFIAILAPVGHYAILQDLVVPGDAAATAAKIAASEGLFRVGICCLLINAILDVVVAWALHIVLKPTNRSVSLLSAWFRIVYATILIVALSRLAQVPQLLNGADYLSAIEPDLLSVKAMLLIDSYHSMWTLGFVVFGLHLATLGALLFRSDHFPRFLGFLVAVAGLGYLVEHMMVVLLPDYGLNMSIYTFVGELLLLVWLLMRGFKGIKQPS